MPLKVGRSVAFGLFLAVFPGALAALAAPQTISVTPRDTDIGFRIYLFGFLPLDGHFTRFAGTLVIDPDDYTRCHVDIQAESASLVMPNAEAQKIALGPRFLDATRFPLLAFAGECHAIQGAPPMLQGMLSMHGRTGALSFSLHPSGDAFTVSAELHRAAWGMGAHPLLARDSIRLFVTTRILPPAAHAEH
jgi:polyisoprenoid-binding protein YceI